MAKKYKGFKGSGMRDVEAPKYETARLAKQISKTLLRTIMPQWFSDDEKEG